MIVSSFEFNYDLAVKELKFIEFSEANEAWLDFICKNGNNINTIEYDVVIGPVADDTVYRVVIEYENGDIDKDLALKKLKVEKLQNQILFHTDKSLKYLKFIESKEYKDYE